MQTQGIPSEALERIRPVVEGLRAQLARQVANLPDDAEMAVDFRAGEESL